MKFKYNCDYSIVGAKRRILELNPRPHPGPCFKIRVSRRCREEDIRQFFEENPDVEAVGIYQTRPGGPLHRFCLEINRIRLEAGLTALCDYVY
jgi:hypothetical protein